MTNNAENIKTVEIVYFSGTGGTRRVVAGFEQELVKRGLQVKRINLDRSRLNNSSKQASGEIKPADLVIVIFPVYAFDAPAPIYDWIQETRSDHQKAAVISVSGGGEVWPNTGCRNQCCRSLEQKGYTVVYDRMMCMPANLLAAVSDHLAMWLIKVIPVKVNQILDDLLASKVKRSRYRMGFIRSRLTQLEKSKSKEFPKTLSIDSKCTGCGYCATYCPVNNIEIQGGKPLFHDKCVICLRCIYSCPSHAISSKSLAVFKSGYNLDDVERRMQGIQLEPVEKCCKGFLWSSVRKYLQCNDSDK